MNIGIILAAGKGSRLNCKDKNKTSLEINGKPLVQYGVDLFETICSKTIVVVGAFEDSVKDSVKSRQAVFVRQSKRMGTGHAAKVAVKKILTFKKAPNYVFLGYGDHMMFYTQEVIDQVLKDHQLKAADITLVSSEYHKPNELAWGRIVRDPYGQVTKIVEQKDASDKELKIKEVNAGFYCFSYGFLKSNIFKLQKSTVTNEYYITDLVELAIKKGGRVNAYQVPFSYVGTGINTASQLEEIRLRLLSQESPSKREFSLGLLSSIKSIFSGESLNA